MGKGRIMSDENLEERLRAVEWSVRNLETLPSDVQLSGESIRIIRGILDDLLDHFDDVDRAQYADDLERLDQIGHLLL